MQFVDSSVFKVERPACNICGYPAYSRGPEYWYCPVCCRVFPKVAKNKVIICGPPCPECGGVRRSKGPAWKCRSCGREESKIKRGRPKINHTND